MPSATAPVGARIATRRAELGITQRTIANEAGVTASAISAIECGLTLPSVLVLKSIAGTLGVTTDELLAEEVPTDEVPA